MLGIGITNIDLGRFVSALNGTTVVIVGLFVIGAIAGPMLTAKIFKFNQIESTIAAGLCMTAQGGAGGIAVLGASNRMELMPYAQITSRIAGSVILVLASVALSA
ncbi:hypothetical protein Zmor_024802 [Zophobas morio]|uniref:Uncharacterized protein n=1 Tax=Zophobas morio TaxID=2755281 RepID=A0AA38HK18_9CUCU|nr:hypothetical protein Zmor_024802 [Zophobas morio]